MAHINGAMNHDQRHAKSRRDAEQHLQMLPGAQRNEPFQLQTLSICLPLHAKVCLLQKNLQKSQKKVLTNS